MLISLKSVSKTSRLVVVHEAPQTCGMAAEIITSVTEKTFTLLKAPPQRVTGFDTPFPYVLEHHYLPTPNRILDSLIYVIDY